jgi:hypothetical protein
MISHIGTALLVSSGSRLRMASNIVLRSFVFNLTS